MSYQYSNKKKMKQDKVTFVLRMRGIGRVRNPKYLELALMDFHNSFYWKEQVKTYQIISK